VRRPVRSTSPKPMTSERTWTTTWRSDGSASICLHSCPRRSVMTMWESGYDWATRGCIAAERTPSCSYASSVNVICATGVCASNC
jgi:hypothetical protein